MALQCMQIVATACEPAAHLQNESMLGATVCNAHVCFVLDMQHPAP